MKILQRSSGCAVRQGLALKLISIKDAVRATGVEAASLSLALRGGGGLMNRRDSVLALLPMGAAGGLLLAFDITIPSSILVRADRVIESAS